MTSRTYDQACSVANFLDSLGSRWTLLIVRDLMIGPRRFKDLLTGLPGIGTNRLASRLAELQEQDILSKAIDPENGASQYKLTKKGRDLEPAILAMARWGMAHLAEDIEKKLYRPDLLVVALRAAFNADVAGDISESYELRIGDIIFHATVEAGRLQTALGPAKQPAFIYISAEDTFQRIVTGSLDEKLARHEGKLQIIGDNKSYRRFLSLFTMSRRT